ncbi:ATP-dependent Clp protease ATP-binding subunit, partial [Candidatus Curtissbacteria bacterium]|nr:ATP-dependent Clp protease ATP-binding subunit [Candidatus Curtissbacteria bacterium]
MDKPAHRPNFFSWHYSVALPQFVNKRLEQLAATPKFFSIGHLIGHLFDPYRRLAVVGKSQKFGVSGLFDRITFNITSSLVGAAVRIALILAWILATILLGIFDLVGIAAWAGLPILSLPLYLEFVNNTFFEEDLGNSKTFLTKLAKSQYFRLLGVFFDESFIKNLDNLAKPASLGLVTGQKKSAMLMNIFQKWPAAKNYFDQKNIKQKDLAILLDYLENHLSAPNKVSVTPIGQMLSFGYTNTLDRFATELTSMQLASPSKQEILSQIEKILSRAQNNNVLLVGEAGVGRHNTLFELAAAISRGQLPGLAGKRVMLLDTIALASAGAGEKETLVDIKNNFEAVFAEAKGAGNIILAIDHIDRLAATKEGRIDITEVLTSILTDNSLPIVGITAPDDFNQFIRPNGNFASLFERIDIAESTVEETTSILIGKALEAFQKEGVKTNFEAILEIAQKSDRLVADRKQPEKSILLFEDAIAEAKSRGNKIVNLPLVDEILSLKTKTPVGKIQESEAAKLKNLEELLHNRIIGQNIAIEALARAMRRARAEIESGTRPIGSFLFLGPTGVGKTETAKALAEAYFGSEDRMVRLDMSEFQESDALARMIGDAASQRPGQLATLIRENPYTLLLLDEFEKATREVHNLFLQILDEGFLTDAFGKKVSFDNV